MRVQEWVVHYNRGRLHSSLGPGFPEPSRGNVPDSGDRRDLPAGHRIAKTPVLGGLHHEYSLVKEEPLGTTVVLADDSCLFCCYLFSCCFDSRFRGSLPTMWLTSRLFSWQMYSISSDLS